MTIQGLALLVGILALAVLVIAALLMTRIARERRKGTDRNSEASGRHDGGEADA
jgi:uncharacterized membrane protein